MLDCRITVKDDGTLKFQVYRKNTHTDQYLQYCSHQPLQHKLGVVRTLTHRARTITTTPDDLDQEYQHLEKVLSVSGYPSRLLVNPSARKKDPHPRRLNKTKVTGHVSIPYIQGVTEALTRKFRAHGIMSHAVPQMKIR